MKDHRKKQRVQEPADADEVAQGAGGTGTTLAMHSSESAPIFGREIPTENAALFRGCVKKALEDPLPVSRLASFPEMNIRDQRDLLFQCKQRVSLLYLCTFFFLTPCCVAAAAGLRGVAPGPSGLEGVADGGRAGGEPAEWL